MAYLGKQPLVGNYQVLDAIVATTTDTYALTKDNGAVAVFPQTPSNCIVSLNGVIQAPVDSYTISGSDIVFASALTASDSIDFITVLGDVLSIGTPTDGTVSLAKLSATGTKDATTFLRGDNTFQTIGVNTPAFSVYLSADQTITNDTFVKITFDTEIYDSGSVFASNKFTPAVVGKYLLNAGVFLDSGVASNLNISRVALYKNGSIFKEVQFRNDSNQPWRQNPTFSHLVDVTSITDYFEVYAYLQSTSTPTGLTVNGGEAYTYFNGYKLIT
jgi:hypothetical protein